MCARPAARHASLIISMDFIIKSCVRGQHLSKEFCILEVGYVRVGLSVNVRKAIQTTCAQVAVKTDATKTIQIKCSNFSLAFHHQVHPN